jgi:SpoVK/Ycf46/Vps4 family AAA+-type ATPase
MRDFGEVLTPEEAEEPILAPATRAALFEWMGELRAADALADVGLKPRSRCLLHGPPGCGKTTLAHHLAARLGMPMVTIGAEGIMASMLGESEKKLTGLFAALTTSKLQCLVFMDEVEAIGGHRSKNRGGGADNARSSILTVLLRKIETYSGLLIAATNRPDDLDPALWRRFHLQLAVDLPGDEERFAILRRYGLPFVWRDEDLDMLADATAGASPALLRGVMEGVKRALILAPRLQRDASDPAEVFRTIVGSVSPPPEIYPPMLWADFDAVTTGLAPCNGNPIEETSHGTTVRV